MNLTAHALPPHIAGWSLIPAADYSRRWMSEQNHFARRCLPLTIANGLGWVIPSPVTFIAQLVASHGQPNDIAITFPSVEDRKLYGHALQSHFGNQILTIQPPWLFTTDVEGTGLLVRGAPNCMKDGATALEGFVETWWLPFTFTMNWRLTSNRPIAFEAGFPLAFLQPFPPSTVTDCKPVLTQLQHGSQLANDYGEWSRSRNAFNADPGRQPSEWQKLYHQRATHPKVDVAPFTKEPLPP